MYRPWPMRLALLSAFGAPVQVATAIGAILVASCAPATAPVATTGTPAVLWQPAATLTSTAAPPQPPFQFVEEDFDGDSPKFTVVDARRAEWRVKLGPEAHTEVAAAALLRGTGYFTDDMHFLARAAVTGVERLKRGREYVESGEVRNAQFEARRASIDRGDTWEWSANPFTGTMQLDGLRVLMVLINNYDARTENNRILEARLPGGRMERRYVVTDLGASFGQYGGLGGTRTKGDLAGYRASRFIERVGERDVTFAYTTRPEGLATTLFVLNPFYAFGELKKERDLHRVPLPAVRWIASRLQQLPDGAIRSAFDDAGYAPPEAAGFAAVVAERIRALAKL